MTAPVRAAHRKKLKTGELAADPGQAKAVEAMARLQERLPALKDPVLPFLPKAPAPKGLYLWGPPGRGKSMLMDLFFETARVEKKRRAHFHEFMAEVHELIGAWREGDKAARRARFGSDRGDDPVAPTAEVVARGARLLCFDEFQVGDIADAMILGRLFEALFERRVLVVATSNRPPEDLYKDGLNRQLFLPFIAMLERRCEVLEIAGPKDFRLDRLRGQRVWFSPFGPEAAAGFDALWTRTVGGMRCGKASVEVLGRRIVFPTACGALVRETFEALCARPLGPQDYLAVAERFTTLFLDGVPRLGPENRSEARRFVTLVDALYEAGVKLVVLADGEPEALYPQGDGAFEFERTVSRLNEMRSAAWLEQAGG
jgi:cell division protein ZapE